MPKPRTIIAAFVVTAIALAIIWRVPQLKRAILGE